MIVWLSVEQVLIRTCRDCGGQWTISEREIAWFESRGLAVPTRCTSCRKARRVQRADVALVQAI